MTAEITGAVATEFEDDFARDLGSKLRGRLIRPTDDDYNEARLVWNGMVDKHPALIVRCAGVADVITTVGLAQGRDLPIAVRGGGHNVAGSGVCDGGLVIDLSLMNSIRVDPEKRTVRAEGGATIGALDHETQAFGLAVPMGLVTATGIAGLTLGGGLGWLRRKHGLSSDNLISVDVVTANGQLITASEKQNRDLFWGVQGGGGNFGVVTSFEYRAHPVGPDVFLAFVVHAGRDAHEALRFYREWAATAPDEVSSLAILWHAPEIEEIPAEYHHAPIVVYLAVHCGEGQRAQQELMQLREFGAPIADLSETLPYLEVQRFFDADYPAHDMRYYWKSHYLAGLPDDAIAVLVDLNESSPSPHSTLDIWQLGGAFSQPGASDTAFGDRSAPFLLGIESNWEHPEDDDAALEWGRTVFSALKPFATGAEYVNFPGLYENHDKMVHDTFGANLDRLVALKKRYDPTNLFHLNHNIRPD
ncbi:MAG: FAD-binding oxidoreductase [Pseudonocardiaceae bacterium]